MLILDQAFLRDVRGEELERTIRLTVSCKFKLTRFVLGKKLHVNSSKIWGLGNDDF